MAGETKSYRWACHLAAGLLSAMASVALAEPTTAPLQPGPGPALAAPAVQMPQVTPQFQVAAPTPVDPSQIAQQVSCLLQIDPIVDFPPTVNFGYPAYRYGEVGYGSVGVSQEAQFAAGIATSTVVLDAAAKAINLTPEQRRRLVLVNAAVTGGRVIRVEVLLRKGDVDFKPDAAGAFIAALCDRITAAFTQSADAQRNAAEIRRTSSAQTLADLQKQLEAVRAHLRSDRDQTAGVTQYGDTSSSSANLRNQRQSVVSELERNRARLKTLEPAAANPLVAEWESVVQLRQQRLDELKAGVASGKSTPADVTEQQAKVAEAQAKLATARQQPDPSSDSSNNRSFRVTETTNLKSTIAEEESRLKQYDDSLAKLADPKFLAIMDEIPDLQQQEQTLRAQVAEMQTRLNQPARSPTTGPTVTITMLGGKSGR